MTSTPPAPPTANEPRGVREPSFREVAAGLGRHAVVPGIVAAIVLWAVGCVILNPLGDLRDEEGINRALEEARTTDWTQITYVWSSSTDTFVAIGFGIAYSLLVWALTRRWWLGILPICALILESSIFVPVTNLLGRPRPEVVHLDPAPPTSSFPSGHTAAAFALYLTLFLLARRIPQRWLRLAVQTVCLIWPFLVGGARLYRGMHHVSDVVVGALLGIWCAWIIVRAVPGAREWIRGARPGPIPPTGGS